MKERLEKLIDVKSIMTLALTVVFCVLALTGIVSGQDFITIFTVIVGFYFGTQVKKSTVDTAAVQYGIAGSAVAEENGTTVESDDETTAQKRLSPEVHNV